MTIDVMDACALIAYLKNEPGGSVIEVRLSDPMVTCYVHAITLCEVYYQMIRESGEPVARRMIADLHSVGIIERNDMDSSFWQLVGQLKARGGISLADCFCLALAIRLSGQVVTSDHGEFDPLVPLGLLSDLVLSLKIRSNYFCILELESCPSMNTPSGTARSSSSRNQPRRRSTRSPNT